MIFLVLFLVFIVCYLSYVIKEQMHEIKTLEQNEKYWKQLYLSVLTPRETIEIPLNKN